MYRHNDLRMEGASAFRTQSSFVDRHDIHKFSALCCACRQIPVDFRHSCAESAVALRPSCAQCAVAPAPTALGSSAAAGASASVFSLHRVRAVHAVALPPSGD